MFDSQLLMASPEGIEIYSPWFPREGDGAICTLDITAISSANCTIEVFVFTKNSETAGDGSDSALNSAISISASATGRYSSEWDSQSLINNQPTADLGLLELVRYKYVVTSEDQSDWVLFRMLDPEWYDAVR